MQITCVWRIGFLGLMLALFACKQDAPPPPLPLGQAKLLECKKGGSNKPKKKKFMPGKADTLELNGHKLIVPASALTAPTEFSIKEVATKKIIKVRLKAGDKEDFHFREGHPATLVLSYTRCDNKDQIAQGSASVYRVKSDDGEDTIPADTMPLPSTHDKDRYSVRASLSRLSGYGLGAP